MVMPNREKRIEVRQSPIHGKGLYALRRFRLGARIGIFEGIETDSDGEHVLWLTDEDGLETGLEGRNELRFLNHACLPNAELDGVDLHAVRNIQPGQEITIDYGEGWEDLS